MERRTSERPESCFRGLIRSLGGDDTGDDLFAGAESAESQYGPSGSGPGSVGIVVVAHGGLAREYVAAIEHMVGKQAGIVEVSIGPRETSATKKEEIGRAVSLVDSGAGVAVVTDMAEDMASSSAIRETSRVQFYGANLPILVKLAKARAQEPGSRP